MDPRNWYNATKTHMQQSRMVGRSECKQCGNPGTIAKELALVLRDHADCTRHPDYLWLKSRFAKLPLEDDMAYVMRLQDLPATAAPRSEMDCLTCGCGIEHHPTPLREHVVCAGEKSFHGLFAGDPVSWTVGDAVVNGHIYYCGDNDATCVDDERVLHSIKNAALPGVLRPLSCARFIPGKVTCVGQSHPMCKRCVDAYAPAIDILTHQAEAHLRSAPKDINPRKRERSSSSQSVRATACTAIMRNTTFADINACPAPQPTAPEVAQKLITRLKAKRFKVECCTKARSGLPAHAEQVSRRVREYIGILTKGARFSNTAVASDETSLYSASYNYPYHLHKLYEAEIKFDLSREGAAGSSSTMWKDKDGYMMVRSNRHNGKHVEMITSLAHVAKEHRAMWMNNRCAQILAAEVKRLRTTGAVDADVATVAEQVEQVMSPAPSVISTQPSATTSNLI